MSDPAESRSEPPAQPAIAARHTRPCSGCGSDVDPLRAARVAIFADRFHYFCTPACREAFTPGAARAPLWNESVPERSSDFSALELDGSATLVPVPAPRSSPLGSSWLHATGLLGVAAALLTLPWFGGLPHWLGPLLAAAACSTLCVSWLGRTGVPNPREGMTRLAAPVSASAAAVALLLLAPQHSPLAASVAGVICAVSAASLALLDRARHSLDARWAQIERALTLEAPESTPEGSTRHAGRELKPGEEVVLKAGDRSPADAVVVAGRGLVEPWLDSTWRVVRQDGDAILAGAQVIEGALRTVVRWVGNDRAWARLTLDPARRADRHLALCKLAERLGRTGAALFGLAGAALALGLLRQPALAVTYAAAAGAALSNVGLSELLGLFVAGDVHRLLLRGICFRTPAALDRAGRTSIVVFCSQGSLLKGEFNVASIEPTGATSTDDLLCLIAGAYASVASPVGIALCRSAQAHQLRPDATRSPNYLPGMGVTAVTSTGQALVVGTRALLLERRISVASAESRIAELEALGRDVLLVALDGRWVGLVALQDTLQPGARAAVQRLLDSRVEPVLLSGDARETSRALARHMGIEHVRPEVLPEDRAQEVRRLAQAGTQVAVVGRGSSDDGALGAAQLSINIDVGGGPLERWDIDIASGDVRDAALAVSLARQLHTSLRVASLTALIPVALAFLLVIAGLPAWSLPLAGLIGTATAWRRHVRAER
jgi:P-type Cu+ transporter